MINAEEESVENNKVIAQLAEELGRLKKNLAEITNRVESIETVITPNQEQSAHYPGHNYDEEDLLPPHKADWSGSNVLLPRLATICFLLVFALILRTVTDNGMIQIRLGSMIGLGYSLALILVGWRLYARQNPLAPVFPICGNLLLFTVVLEVHSRFGILSTLSSHIFLFLSLLGVAAVGLKYKTPTPLFVGVIGSVLVGLSLGFPNPMFPATGSLLLAGMFIAFWASERQVTRSLRWIVLLLLMIFWLIWWLKMFTPINAGAEPTATLFPGWYFPFLFTHLAIFFVFSLVQIRRNDGSLNFYEAMLPSINVAGAFITGISVAVPWLWSARQAGILAVIMAFGYFACAAFLSKREKSSGAGTNAFVMAGVILFGMGLPFAAGGVAQALPLWSVGGFLLALFSARWQSGGVRATSYLFQTFACVAALFSGVWSVDASALTGIALALLLAVMAIVQYQWCRLNSPPREGSVYFSWLDVKDSSALVLLIAGLIAIFAGLRLGLFVSMEHFLENPANAFRCGQTVLVNIGAALLIYLALKIHRGEIMTIALAVGILGAAKVFFYDMFTANGIPLVASVFSFGVLAALGSVATSRRHQAKNLPEAIMTNHDPGLNP